MNKPEETINCEYRTKWTVYGLGLTACKLQPKSFCWRKKPGCELEEKYGVAEEVTNVN